MIKPKSGGRSGPVDGAVSKVERTPRGVWMLARAGNKSMASFFHQAHRLQTFLSKAIAGRGDHPFVLRSREFPVHRGCLLGKAILLRDPPEDIPLVVARLG